MGAKKNLCHIWPKEAKCCARRVPNFGSCPPPDHRQVSCGIRTGHAGESFYRDGSYTNPALLKTRECWTIGMFGLLNCIEKNINDYLTLLATHI